ARSEEALNAIKLYSPAMAQASAERLEIEAGIRLALQHNQFQLFFQPIIDAHTGQLSAAEALLRCDNEALKSVRIDKVIDVAEQTSLIASIDAWVVNRALEHMQEWCDQGLHLPKVSINISGKQLTNVAFMERVYERISAVRFSPSRVQIEVTETSKLADVETAAAQLKRLQHLGVQIALDDFGTGQASLTYLQRLHPDVVKIDRSFATGVNTNHANATLVSAMTVMSHCLGLKVVVEGVEDQEQLDFLRETRCDEIQGYFFSKPMPVVQMTQWLASYVLEHGAKAYAPDVANRPGPHGSHTVSAMQSHVPPHLAAPVNPSSDPRQPYSAASLPRQQSNGAAATMPDNTPLEPGMPAPTAAQNPAPNAINEPVRKSTAAA
ncbi:MAG: EAL domain-containing protein, partial [Pseudomonadota bacterium]